MKPLRKILLSGGGTGGHIYPAIAIADELKRRHPDAVFLFVGAEGRMEMEKVPKAGYTIKGLNISGLQRSLSLKNLSFPFKLMGSLLKARKIISEFNPDVVIGTGGYASGPTLFMANKKGIPTLIQEQNSYPGITNKLLAKKADKICVAYDGLETYFPKEKMIKTGNPVRQDLLDIDSKRDEALRYFKLSPGKTTLVVLGGSLGARMINRIIEHNLGEILENGVQIIWQSGKLYYDEYQKYNKYPDVQVHAFIEKMELLYAASDIILSRAGAGTISELCLVGKPVLFIPSPNVAEDHQTKNAEAVVKNRAAEMVKEDEAERFIRVFKEVLNDKSKQKELSENIKKMALPRATSMIADAVEAIVK